ncbi:MAG: hypothetical protein AVDCRST_MAG20-2491 [uncultured Acidimicrobiales bacterium]|uniref:Uncharacterized protein n=1 Tax=uncultured Acidimicrobiales bacterium TaxID=310071 RepID=A0A6J4IRC3_9ACTN|nr:MAG: hypothetical protein AVDCRST_MAG20-2491 [uncultured Acidimicrobiales bacterium]
MGATPSARGRARAPGPTGGVMAEQHRVGPPRPRERRPPAAPGDGR